MQTSLSFAEGTERTTVMESAMKLADHCWAKASRVAPEFVEAYLTVAMTVLSERRVVTGDMFRAACKAQGVSLPSKLHHNTWVSAVRALQTIGWISPMDKVEPKTRHNHMPTVTLWQSQIWREQ